MLRYVAVGTVVRIGIKRVVPDSSQARIRGIERAALLIEIGIGHIQHEAVLVVPRKFGLERVRISVPEVSVREQKLSNQREWQSSQILRRISAVSLSWIANGDAISLGCSKRSRVRSEFVE